MGHVTLPRGVGARGKLQVSGQPTGCFNLSDLGLKVAAPINYLFTSIKQAYTKFKFLSASSIALSIYLIKVVICKSPYH